jgi:hypothetical protein
MKIFCLVFSLTIFSSITQAQQAQRFNIIIDEIFADPSPQVGLPNAEFIELRNTSSTPFNLDAWLLKDNSSSAVLPDFILQPDSVVIICGNSAAAAYSAFGTTLGVSNFPSLDNDGETISLISAENNVIHAVGYSSDWFQNELKKGGGWSLEMIDPTNPCSGASNWAASKDLSGGTPGKINSVNGINADVSIPSVLRAFATDSVTLQITFNESLRRNNNLQPTNFTISDGIANPLTANFATELFDVIELKLVQPLQNGKVYTVSLNNISDCAGNVMPGSSVTVGLSGIADSLDVVINEILFDPKIGGEDYIELYNRSSAIINLKELYIANKNSSGIISSIKQISTDDKLFFPSEFLVITESPSAIQQEYFAPDPKTFIQVSSLPSFPNDKGDVIILNKQGDIIDEVVYADKWHFQLITDVEGVSLERLDYNGPSAQANFHSASSTAGYGTPGYKNSQVQSTSAVDGVITVTPKVFSPDNDGFDDVATLNYKFAQTGNVATISIFDAGGRPVRYLERNSLTGLEGFFRWDGLNDKHQQLPQGIYLFYIEVFNTSGKKQQFKQTIVLARK